MKTDGMRKRGLCGGGVSLTAYLEKVIETHYWTRALSALGAGKNSVFPWDREFVVT